MDFQNALEFVQLYYERTWNNLLWFFGIAITIVGFIVPFIVQWILSKNNDKRVKELSESNYKQIKELSESLQKDFDSKIATFNENHKIMQNELLFTQGSVYIVQGNILMKSNENEIEAKILHAFLYAAYCFLKTERGENLNFVIWTLINIVTSPNFPTSISSNVDRVNVREIYDITLSLFEKNNIEGKYTTIIQMLKEKIKFKN